MKCDNRRPHEPHVWSYERIVQDTDASIRAGEPVGVEMITEERCPGVRPTRNCGNMRPHAMHMWQWIVSQPVRWEPDVVPEMHEVKVVTEVCPGVRRSDEVWRS
jgi:hypothetical protein